jgi:hypothetical protein
MVEADHQRAVRARGLVIVSDGSIVVEHVQSLGFGGTLAVHFHNGRCQAGFDAAALRARRLAGMVLAPLRIVRGTALVVLRTVLRKRRCAREAVLASPLIALLLSAHVAGEVVGLLAGPGDSPRHMR